MSAENQKNPASNKCSVCGAALPDDLPAGLCAACLLAVGLPTENLKEEEPTRRSTIRLSLPPVAEKPGDKIGRYKLLQQIGEGGCGVVYLADQEEPVRRRVALKVIKPGMDTREVLGRFEAERQALALMDHSNIAKVFDAGATETGRPFFVMELVRGIPITRYCDENKLSTEQRLNLFIQVCQAIQHAHQKGIIHRDIKPSNVLVADYDGVPVPKIIDFGIAKATAGQTLTDKTVFTALEQFIGTPAYMSPEQAKLSGLDIDTRSDIYSLGVLLYELLTGKTPFDAKRLFAAGFDEIRRIIREEEPQCPSQKLSTLAAEEQTTTARCRQTDSPRLIHLVRGDLDWIVMKCLEKDRNRRYETANGLAMELARFLNDEPIVARPPSNLYRLQKLVRRNKLAFAAVGAVAASLILGLALSTWLFVREKNAHQKENKALQRAVTAEKSAQTEAQRAGAAASEAKMTLATSDFLQAGRLIEEGNRSDALAYLSRSLSLNPTNDAALTRLATLLTYHSWLLPTIILTNVSTRIISSNLNLTIGNPAQFSPDGQRILTITKDELRLWSSQTGQPLTVPLLNNALITSAEFSPDGKQILATSTNEVRIWEVETGQLIAGPLKAASNLISAQFSADGKRMLITSTSKVQFCPDAKRMPGISVSEVRVWDTKTGQPATEPLKTSGPVSSAQFDSVGKRILVVSANTVQVFDAQSGVALTELLNQHPNPGILSAQFNPDGNRVNIVLHDGTVSSWDTQSGERLPTPLIKIDRLRSAQFNQDGSRLATLSWNHTGQMWDTKTGEPLAGLLKSLNRLADEVPCLSHDGKKVLVISGDTVRVFDAQNGNPLTEPLKHNSPVHSAQFSPDGTSIITVSEFSTVRVWRPVSGPALPMPLRTNGYIASVQFSLDGKQLLTVSVDGAPRIWSTLDGKLFSEPLKESGAFLSAQFSSDGKRILTVATNELRVWNAQTGRAMSAPLKQAGQVLDAQFSVDGGRILTIYSTNKVRVSFEAHSPKLINFLLYPRGETKAAWARVWDTQRSESLAELKLEGDVAWAQLSADGKRIVTSGNSAQVWDAQTGRPLSAPLERTGLGRTQFSPDGRKIIAGSLGQVKVWDAQSGGQQLIDLHHTDFVTSAELSRDGKHILTTSGRIAHVWDGVTGERIIEFLKHEDLIESVQFGPKDNSVASISAAGDARLWDLQSGQELMEPLTHVSSIMSAQFSPDGKRLVTASTNGSILVWTIKPAGSEFPEWLIILTEAISGKVLNKTGVLVPTQLNRFKVINDLGQELSQMPDDKDWVIWGRWFLADPSSRTISPFSNVTFPEYVENLINEGTAESLSEAESLVGTNANLLERIAETRKLLAEKYHYAGGYFQKVTAYSPAQWIEYAAADKATYHFQELKRDHDFILLNDARRNFKIQIPVNGGMSNLSADDGATWRDLYAVTQNPADASPQRPKSPRTMRLVERYTYPGGNFARWNSNSQTQWMEYGSASSATFHFEELKRDNKFILLKDASRNVTIQIPVAGGMSRISTDGGTNWGNLYELHKE